MNANRHIQPLESRRLLSGSWTTVDTDPTSGGLWGMAADKFGNVYSVGSDAASNSGILRQESGGVWSTVLIANSDFDAVTTDAFGNVFIVGSRHVMELRVGQSSLSVVATGDFSWLNAIATDTAGDVFVTGTRWVTTIVKNRAVITKYGTVTRLTPAADGSFTASTATVGQADQTYGITVIPSGAAAGVYAVGYSGSPGTWVVFKSTDGGGTWTTVDQFRYSTSGGSFPYAVTGDAAGNVYVAGSGFTSVLTGYSHNKPVYSTRVHWLARKSSSGGSGSWATVDDYLPAGATNAEPLAMGTDLAGNVYAVGYAGKSYFADDAIVRTNADGSWATSDDYASPTDPAHSAYCYNAFAVDSSGTLYAGGDDMNSATPPPTFVRSMAGPPPASPTQTAAALSPLFSTTSIAGASQTTSQTTDTRLVDELFPA